MVSHQWFEGENKALKEKSIVLNSDRDTACFFCNCFYSLSAFFFMNLVQSISCCKSCASACFEDGVRWVAQ